MDFIRPYLPLGFYILHFMFSYWKGVILFIKTIKNETVVSIFDAPDLPMKDFDKLALELEVESLAKIAGRDNLPNENSTSEDATEIKFR